MRHIILFFGIFLYTTAHAQNPAANPDIPQHDPPVTKQVNKTIGEAGNDTEFDMAPETTIKVVRSALASLNIPLPAGPFQPTWESIEANYKVPGWLQQAKFGICMHWGLYAVPAYHNEWYEKHMYGSKGIMEWHQKTFGPQETFGYKDFIPMFTMDKFNADAYADLFKKAGAKFIMPACQHHDNFALWDSKVTPYNSMQMGPKRDLIGELSIAVRKQGMKFGFTNHGIENFQFINPPQEMLDKMKAAKADLFDPKWADFYNVADRSDEACRKFLVNWFQRNVELINKYKPDILWFDNGIDQRYLDPLKVQLAAYYYNTAKKWGKDVTINTKKAAFAPAGTNINTIGSILDFENKVPPGIRTGVWDVDVPIGSSWGYTEGMRVDSAGSILKRLIDIVSKNGIMILNLSPKADGTIPENQQQSLLGVGEWLAINGEAIYGTHSWVKFKDDENNNIRFTVKGNNLYAIILGKMQGETVTISSLAKNKVKGKISSVNILGAKDKPLYKQDEAGLTIQLPKQAQLSKYAFVVKIEGLQMNASTYTTSGNPMPE